MTLLKILNRVVGEEWKALRVFVAVDNRALDIAIVSNPNCLA